MLLPAPGLMAQSFNPNNSILSAFKDVSNFWGSQTRFGFDLFNDTGADLFVNSFDLLPGFGYDNAIGLEVPIDIVSSQPLGTPIADGIIFTFFNAAQRSGAVDASVMDGIYDFSLELLGGSSDTSMDSLGAVSYQIHIAEGINVSITQIIATPSTIGAGDTTTINLTVSNDDLTETFITSTPFFVGGGMTQGSDQLENVQFVGNWFDRSIAPGDSLSGDHTTWDATITTPLGSYIPNLGIRGGLYLSDEHFLLAITDPLVTVVPEPTSLGLLAIGAALLLRRRRA